MGVAYQDVVKACIEGDWGRPVSVDNGVDIAKLVHLFHLSFERLVVNPIPLILASVEQRISQSAIAVMSNELRTKISRDLC